jgi:fructan beta-fructosidase
MLLRWLLIIAGAGILVPLSSPAGLLGYEGFNYSASGTPSLGGLNGGIGWNAGWVNVAGGGGVVSSDNLVLGNQGAIGFDARSLGCSAFVANARRSGRLLDCTANGNFGSHGYVDGSGRIGADGKTLYASFLQQPNVATLFYEFEFHRADLGDPGRIAGIGNDFNSTTVNLRAPNSLQTPLGMGNTNVNFYVMRIDFKAGNDDVYVYRNPLGSTEADNEPVLTMLSVSDMSFDGISLAAFVGTTTVQHDEIRLGETWGDVLGGPPLFVLQPTNQTLYAGQPVGLTSLAQSIQPLKYQWYFGAAALADKTNANLSLAGVQLSDAGQYSVVASNALGVAMSSTATLTVLPINVAITSPQTVTIGSGGNLVINASVGGTPLVFLQWFRDGAAIPGATSSTYSLSSASAFDAGLYVLVASNSYGSVTSSIVSVAPNFGGLLAYEGFGYGAMTSDIGGSSGGFGWANAWVNLNGGTSQTLSNNLVAGKNGPTGYDTHSADGALFVPNASRKGRYLDCTPTGTIALRGYVDANGNVGADGKTVYLSFLQQPNDTSLFYEFELHRNDLGDGGRMGGIGNDTGDTQVHLRIQSPPGGGSTHYDLGAGNTNVDFYVMRIDFKADNDDVFVYRNPTSATEPITPTLTVSNAADMSFNSISLAAYLNGRTVTHDEVRVGMTWADVVGNTVSQLQLAQRTSNSSQLRLAGSPNYTFGLQAATNLTGPWSNIGSISVSSLGLGQFVETNANDQRFYRATNSSVWHTPSPADIVFADFEQPTYGAWVATGNAFGSGPAPGTLPNQQVVSGYVGSGLANSYLGGDTSTGTLTSPPFVITKPYLNFLIGGGNVPGQECLNLIVSNVVVKTATGGNAEVLTPRQWEVSACLGQTATLQIVDLATGGWGHINVDQITFSDAAFQSQSLFRTMFLTNSLLNFPVKNGAPMRRVTFAVGGNPVRDFDIELADGAPDWWAYTEVSAYSNQTATISVSNLTPGSTGLSSIAQSNGIVGATNLYQETLRSQIHFSSARGWLNDANGVFYHGGKYHLYYQHNPYGWNWGNMHWGHAVSADMVNWTQVLAEGIYPDRYGDMVFSGSAVVDTANTSGFKTGTNDVIVAAFTSTGRGECIAFSNDGGQAFSDFTNNPVVVHNGRDPHLLWYAPSNYWVMALYDETGGGGISFYTSPNLRQWTYRSKINGYFECPDIFQLPVDGNTNNLLWLLCDASSGYQLGQFNGVTFTPSTAKLPGNSGDRFYASQTFTSMAPGDKRLARIGWAIIDTPGMPFNQMMYFPTELNLRTTTNGVRLFSTPIAEITNNAVVSYAWTNLTLSPGNNPLAGIRGTLFDVKAQFTVGTAQSITFTFQGVTVTYSAATQQISCNGVVNPLPPIGGSIQLEIIVDRKTIEIFGHNGQLYMPLPANNPTGTSLISLTCSGGNATFNSLTVNKLKSIWTGSSK